MKGAARFVPRLLYPVGFGSLVVLALMLDSAPGEARLGYQVEAANETYVRLCSPCHGAAGEGSEFGPALAGGSVADRIAIITDGSSAMPAFGSTLTPEQVDEVVAFLATMDAADDAVATGRAVYAEHCAACHGAQGDGGAAPSLQDGTLPLAELIGVVRDGRGGMPAYGQRLTVAELEAVAAVGVALQSPAADADEPGPAGPPAARGAQIFAESCAGCHGPEAAGGLGPNLRTTSLTPDDLSVAVRQGAGTMPSFTGRLEAADIEAVVEFVEGLARGAGEGGGPVEPDLVARGAELFTANCARCHGPDASGAFGPSLKYSTLTDVEMVSVISNGLGAMPSFSEILSSADATALVAFVESTRPTDGAADSVSAVAHGREVFVGSCATCHGFDGSGGVGPSLANTRLTANEIISQVFGIHADRMPAFEGVLDASQVQDVARYVLTIEGDTRSQLGWLVAGGAALLVLVGAGVLWFTGLPAPLARRFR